MKASELIRQRFANAPGEWLVSKEGRDLWAKSLWNVRKLEGRKAAKELDDEIWVFVVIPMP